MKTFLRRWWLTRQLHKYVHGHGEILDVMTYQQSNRWPDFHKSTRDDRVRLGVADEMFITSYLEGRIARLLNDNSKVIVRRTFNECISSQWVESRGDRWNVGLKGTEVYMWYYPIFAFEKFLSEHKFVSYLIVGVLWLFILKPYIMLLFKSFQSH